MRQLNQSGQVKLSHTMDSSLSPKTALKQLPQHYKTEQSATQTKSQTKKEHNIFHIDLENKLSKLLILMLNYQHSLTAKILKEFTLANSYKWVQARVGVSVSFFFKYYYYFEICSKSPTCYNV